MAGRRGRIRGTGRAVPERVLTNAELERMVDTHDEWIVTRTGIKERRIAGPDESLSTFAVPAARAALEMAEVEGSEVDLVLCATVTPDTPFPATANRIQDQIGATRAGSFDLSAGCTGFVYALSVGEQFIESGMARNVLVVGGEILSKITDWTDRSTCVLFGDGAGAVLLQATEEEGKGVLGCAMHSDGSLSELIFMPGGGSRNPPSNILYESGLAFLKMKGNETFKIAVRSLAEVSQEVLAKAGLTEGEVDWFIPHQANLRIIEPLAEKIGAVNAVVARDVSDSGNTSAASIPLAFSKLVEQGVISTGDPVLLFGFGGNLSYAGQVVRCP